MKNICCHLHIPTLIVYDNPKEKKNTTTQQNYQPIKVKIEGKKEQKKETLLIMVKIPGI